MKYQMQGGTSIDVGDRWVRLDISIELDDKEIKNPKLYQVEQKAKKAMTICSGIIGKQLEQMEKEAK